MTRNIAVVLFEDAEELDFVGPWEVFTMLRHVTPEPDTVYTVAEHAGMVRCAKGLRVEATYSFADCPPPDLIVVPGGQGSRTEMNNPAMLAFVKSVAERGRLVTSVCTGAFVLASAGLLEGKRATTHWASMDALRQLRGITVVEQRFVDEGAVITASGVSAGIDMALHVVGRLYDPETARKVQKYMEYHPEPPYGE